MYINKYSQQFDYMLIFVLFVVVLIPEDFITITISNSFNFMVLIKDSDNERENVHFFDLLVV